MARDDVKYESKTVRAVRGTEARTITKWEQNGWEVIGRTPGKLQTEIALRRPRPRAPWLRAAIAGGVALILIVFALIMSVIEDEDPEDEPVAAAQSPEETENSEGSEKDEPEPAEAAPTAAEASPTGIPGSEPAAEIITVDNNSDFATLVSTTGYCSDQIGAFAEEYAGQPVRFDGSIDAMGPHGNYDTRYDILLTVGDYSEISSVGPEFQFRDVKMADLSVTGEVPDTIGIGDNLTVTATVGEYIPEQCLFLLDPQETTVR